MRVASPASYRLAIGMDPRMGDENAGSKGLAAVCGRIILAQSDVKRARYPAPAQHPFGGNRMGEALRPQRMAARHGTAKPCYALQRGALIRRPDYALRLSCVAKRSGQPAKWQSLQRQFRHGEDDCSFDADGRFPWPKAPDHGSMSACDKPAMACSTASITAELALKSFGRVNRNIGTDPASSRHCMKLAALRSCPGSIALA